MKEGEKPCRTKAGSGSEKSLREDEALETIWELRESGDVKLQDVSDEIGREYLYEMQDDHLIFIKDEKVYFTDEGYDRARCITRRHLLAERLFADVLDLREYEDDACRLEHAISPDVEEAICTFLGHPTTCPHGRPIPQGNCCKLYTKKIDTLVQSLAETEVGRTLKVVFINAPAMERLSSMGLIPGVVIRLIQRKPSVVLSIDETTIAIDDDIARGIYVKQWL